MVSPSRCKAVPIQDRTGSYGSRRLGLPEFVENQHMKVARLSAPHTGRLNTPPPPRRHTRYLLIIKPTRCASSSNLFLE